MVGKNRQRKIDIITKYGVQNADVIAEACREVDLPLAVGAALVGHESGGKNIYGHDLGGALSTRGKAVAVCGKIYPEMSDIEVDYRNSVVFFLMIGAGAKSNGLGLTQLTFADDLHDGRTGGFFRQAADDHDLDPVDPLQNCIMGLGHVLKPILVAQNWDLAKAGTVYNHGSMRDGINDYGLDFRRDVAAWETRWIHG